MANTMCPQDYVDLVRRFLAHNARALLPFTVDTVTKYCIKKTPELDPGDEEIIKHIVTETLEMYHGKRCLKQVRNTYHVAFGANISDVEGFVLEDPKPMKPLSKEMTERLDDIDRRTRYNNDPFCTVSNLDDPHRDYERY